MRLVIQRAARALVTVDFAATVKAGRTTMTIEEAIVYVLAERNGGLKTDQIAEIINRRKLHVRKDGQPVSSAQVYAAVMRNLHTFAKSEGRIMLLM